MFLKIFLLFAIVFSVQIFFVESKEFGHLDLTLLASTLNSTWLSPREKIYAISFFKDITSIDNPSIEDVELLTAHLLTEELDENGLPYITQEDLDILHEAFPSTCTVNLEDMTCTPDINGDCFCVFDYIAHSKTVYPEPVSEEIELTSGPATISTSLGTDDDTLEQ